MNSYHMEKYFCLKKLDQSGKFAETSQLIYRDHKPELGISNVSVSFVWFDTEVVKDVVDSRAGRIVDTPDGRRVLLPKEKGQTVSWIMKDDSQVQLSLRTRRVQ